MNKFNFKSLVLVVLSFGQVLFGAEEDKASSLPPVSQADIGVFLGVLQIDRYVSEIKTHFDAFLTENFDKSFLEWGFINARMANLFLDSFLKEHLVQSIKETLSSLKLEHYFSFYKNALLPVCKQKFGEKVAQIIRDSRKINCECRDGVIYFL